MDTYAFLCRSCFLIDDLQDLADVHLMGGLGAVELSDDLGGEVFGLHVLGEELAAQERPAGLLVGHGLAAGDGGQSGLLILVAVPAGQGAHDAQGLLAILGVKGHGEKFILLEIAVGVPIGTDIDRGHGLAPEGAHAAPGDGHGIVILRASGGDQGPVVCEFIVCIHQKLAHVHSSFFALP